MANFTKTIRNNKKFLFKSVTGFLSQFYCPPDFSKETPFTVWKENRMNQLKVHSQASDNFQLLKAL